MTTPPLPGTDRVRSLPQFFDTEVGEDLIDENGHMNISGYFRDGTWALWRLVQQLGVDRAYIDEREMSFFTVEHHIRYLGELRLGQRYSVHCGMVGRTAKAAHGLAFVVDETNDKVACSLEIMYVHVSMTERRSVEIPDDVAAALDDSLAEHPWLGEFAGGLSLRR